MRCVLRLVDASKCVCGRGSGFGKGIGNGEWKGLGGMEWKEKGRRGMEIRGLFASLAIGG